MAMNEWMQKEAEGVIPSGDYVVTAILDERKRRKGKMTEYIVKWQVSMMFVHKCCQAGIPYP